MSSEKLTYYTIISKETGDATVRVADRGQRECASIYQEVVSGLGNVQEDETIPEGDCDPVHDHTSVGGG